MTNPVLVEITRGDLVESVHRGSVAIADASGNIRFALGDLKTPIYPRSSLKPIQALPLLESGAADAFGLSEEEISLACASHSGEPMHTTRVASWLARIGCIESDLACGAHPSRYEPVAEDMIRRGDSRRVSTTTAPVKHAGFLTVARHWISRHTVMNSTSSRATRHRQSACRAHEYPDRISVGRGWMRGAELCRAA
ncbi:MAG: asparaginase [Rhizomicrobium sp.]